MSDYKLEFERKEYKRALQDEIVASKVLSAIRGRLKESGAALAELLAGFGKGSLLHNVAKYKMGYWIVEGFSIESCGIEKISVHDVRIHCRKRLKSGLTGTVRAIFYGYEMLPNSDKRNRPAVILLSQPGTKGGESNGETQERTNAVC